MLIKRPNQSSPRPIDLDRPIFLVGAPCAGGSPLFELLSRARGVLTLDTPHRQELRTLLNGRSGSLSDRLLSTDAEPELVGSMQRVVRGGLRDLHGDAPRGGAARWLNGATSNGWRIPFLSAAFPDAQFIYVYREPREQLARMISAWLSGQFVTRPTLSGWSGPDWSFSLVPGWDMLRGKPVAEIAAAQWASTTSQILTDLAALPARRWCAVHIDDLLAHRAREAALLGRFAGLSWRVQPSGVHRSRGALRPGLYAAEVETIFPAVGPIAKAALEAVRTHHASHRELPEENLWQSIKALPEQAAKALLTGRLTAGLVAGAAFVPAVASAATDTVTNDLDDMSAGSLRETIANAAAGDTIAFAPALNGETILLTGGPIGITKSLTITGPGSGLLTIDGGRGQALDAGMPVDGGSTDAGFTTGARIFYLYAAPATPDAGQVLPVVTISGLTLQNAGATSNGGAISSTNAALTLEDVTLKDNYSSGYGAGLYASRKGTLTIQNSLVTGNTAAYGGGVYVTRFYGNTLIDHVTFSGNTATRGGGGLYIRHQDPATEVTISSSTFADNTALDGRGGGICIADRSKNITILESTASGNLASEGAGIFFYGSGAILNTTVTGNQAGKLVDGGFVANGVGGGVYLYNANVTIASTTISGNSAATAGGIFSKYQRAVVTDSIVAGNQPDDLACQNADAPLEVSFSLIENPGSAIFVEELDAGVPDGGVPPLPDGGAIPGTGNIGWVDPQLGSLANNGGPTKTLLPARTSPAVNAGDPNFATDLTQYLLEDYDLGDGGLPDGSVPPVPLTDQRGLPRIVGEVVDMGAVELPPPYVDAGPPYVDAGPVVVDAGASTDGGVVEDAGSEPDAGVSTDAGGTTDAGSMSGADAGSTSPTDAGTTGSADAGSSGNGKSGCNCNSSSDAALALLSPLGALLLRRRRKSSQAA